MRRYEDIAVRRMSRVCDDLIKLHSETLEESAEPQLLAEAEIEDRIRQSAAATNLETRAPAFGDMERESEEPGRGSAIEDMNLEGPEGGADDWDKTITITYDPALDCSRGDRFAETPAKGEPLQPGGEQENRISASTGGVASGRAEDTQGAIHAQPRLLELERPSTALLRTG